MILQRNKGQTTLREDSPEAITYAKAGVDINRANAVLDAILPHCLATHDDLVVSGLGPFASAVRIGPIVGSMEDPLLVQSADGPGTGLQEAMDALRDLLRAQGTNEFVDDLLMRTMADGFAILGYNNVLHGFADLACGGPWVVPTTVIDTIDSTDMDPFVHELIVRGMMEACLSFPADERPMIVGGECAQMKGTIVSGQYNFGITATGFIDMKYALRPKQNTRPGNIVVGAASNGIHLNGFSLQRMIRKSLGMSLYDSDVENGLAEPFLTELLRRQPNYAWIARQVAAAGIPIMAIAHITGGGLFDNNLRNLPDGCRMVIDASAWPIPPFMQWLVKMSNVPFDDAFSALNMGIGQTYTLATHEDAEECVEYINGSLNANPSAWIIGEIVEGDCGVEINYPD